MDRGSGKKCEAGYFIFWSTLMKPTDNTTPPDGLQKAVFFCFCGFLLVALNVIIDPRAMDISLMPRLLALQVFLLFVVTVVVVTPLAGNLDGRVVRDPLIICFAGYTALTAFSLPGAVNTTAGFTEIFKTFAVLLVLVLASLVLPWQRSWPVVVMKCAVAAGWLSAAAGLYDWITGPGWGWHGRPQMLAVMGLMSNVNLYASFLLLVWPLGVAAAFALRGPWRWVAAVAVAVLLLMMLALQTRAVYLGLIVAVGAGLLAASMARARFSPGTARILAGAAVVLGFAVAGFMLLAPKAVPVVERMHSIFAEQSMTAAGGRPVIWLATLGMIRDHPLTGVGAGNFPVRLHEYFDTDDPEFSTVHPNWLQPHNDFLWVLAEKGVAAAALFLGVWILAFRHLLGALRHGLPRTKAWLAMAGVSGLAGYGVVSFFDFPLERINHQIYFAFYLAIAVLLGRVPAKPSVLPANLWRAAATVVAVVLVAGTIYATAALRQERLILLTRLAFAEQDWESAAVYAQRATTGWKTLDPFATPVSYLEGTAHLMLADHRRALGCFEQAHAQMPSRAYTANSLALAHNMLGNYAEAIKLYEKVLTRSPGHRPTVLNLADAHTRAGHQARALELLNLIPREEWTDAARSVERRATDPSARRPAPVPPVHSP